MTGKLLSKATLIQWGDFINPRRISVEFLFFLLVTLNIILFPHRTPEILDVTRLNSSAISFWGLITLGVGIRFWAAGNLRKNEELSLTGPYQLVRHPLYLGSLIIYLTVFLTFGHAFIGLVLFTLLFVGLYLPLMAREERNMSDDFPNSQDEYFAVNRIIPDPFRLLEAVKSDAFTFECALKNSGLGSFWIIPGIALFYLFLERLIIPHLPFLQIHLGPGGFLG